MKKLFFGLIFLALAVPSWATVIISDTGAGTNGAVVDGRTPDTVSNGHTWYDPANYSQIFSNAINFRSGSFTISVPCIETNLTSYTVEADINLGEGDANAGITFRVDEHYSGTFADGSTGIVLMPYIGGNCLLIRNMSNGTLYAPTYTFANNTWYHFKAAVTPTSFTVYIDGVQLGSTYTDSTYGANTKVGIFVSSGTNGVKNFAVDDGLTATPTFTPTPTYTYTPTPTPTIGTPTITPTPGLSNILYQNNFTGTEPPNNFTQVVTSGATSSFTSLGNGSASIAMTSTGIFQKNVWLYNNGTSWTFPYAVDFDVLSNTINSGVSTAFLLVYVCTDITNTNGYYYALNGAITSGSYINSFGTANTFHKNGQINIKISPNDHVRFEFYGNLSKTYYNGTLVEWDTPISGTPVNGTFGLGVVGTTSVSNSITAYTIANLKVSQLAFNADFYGTALTKPDGWTDNFPNPGMNTSISYSTATTYSGTTSLASISIIAGNIWGRVYSPSVSCTAQNFPIVEINVNSLTAGATWKAGVWRNGTPWDYHELNTSNTMTGVFDYNYQAITDWTGAVQFFIQLVVESLTPGAALVVDWIKVMQ